MKNIRFLSVAIAVIMASFVSVAAQGSFTHNMTVLNGMIAVGSTVGHTAPSNFTGRGTSSQSMTRVVVRGNLGLSTNCLPGTGVIQLINPATNQVLGQASVPLNTMFSNVVINFPAGQPANGTYAIRGQVTRLQPVPPNTICGISLTSGSALVEWR
ncbi:MAG: hypothetical protein FWE23_10965 [Chitinivibrionia bacterium]|nr:hypothetical protein [Chitinivibrionia bacterium]